MFTTNNIEIRFDKEEGGGFVAGFEYGATEKLSNGITTYSTKYVTSIMILLMPIPFKNGGTFNTTIDHITVLEYIG